jgi:ribosomal protein S18 acetylase RimI-like enzyme
MRFQDVTSQASEAEFLEVIALAVGYPTPDKLASIVKAYGSSSRRLFALVTEDGVAGIVGIELPVAGRSRILHIAVPAQLRGRGIGRRLLTEVLTTVGATELVAQTDTDAVGFYRACGFAVYSLGEMYPGVERFECALNTVQ